MQYYFIQFFQYSNCQTIPRSVKYKPEIGLSSCLRHTLQVLETCAGSPPRAGLQDPQIYSDPCGAGWVRVDITQVGAPRAGTCGPRAALVRVHAATRSPSALVRGPRSVSHMHGLTHVRQPPFSEV